VNQGFELTIWVGMAGVALVWAHLVLWHTRRVLNRDRMTAGLPEVASVPCPALVPSPVLVPAPVLTSSVVAKIAS